MSLLTKVENRYYLKTTESGCGDIPESQRNSWSEVGLQGTILLSTTV